MPALLLTADLGCSSKVAGAAARQEVALETAMSVRGLLDKAAGAALVLLDLTTPGLDVGQLVPQLRALSPPPGAIIAFGPHVHESRLAAAAAAGCDEVLSRGQFHHQIDELLGRHRGG